jgi:hypothetical protein
MKRLCITCPIFFGAVEHNLDFSGVTTLESLEIGAAYIVQSPIKLPASITSVKIGSVACVRPIHLMERLPRLVHLTIKAFYDHKSRYYFESVTWPASLTSLSISMRGAPHLVRLLPPSLTRLSVAVNSKSPPTELADLTEVIPALTSLRLRNGPAKINLALPSTLKKIKIDKLVVDAGKTLLDAFRLVPASVTYFSCQTYTSGGVDEDLSVEDLQASLHLLLPRLTLENMENIIGALEQTSLNMEVFMDDDFADLVNLFEGMCAKHGVGAGYLSYRLPRWRQRMSQQLLGHVVEHALSDEDAIRIAGSRRHMTESGTCGSDNDVGVSTVKASLKMLELGLTRTLDMPYKPVGLAEMSMAAIHNLVKIRLHADAIDAFLEIVERVKLVCLEVIEIKDLHRNDFVLTYIHMYRDNLPRLDQILLPDKMTYIPRISYDLLARDMRIFQSTRNKLVRRVAWKPSQEPPVWMPFLINLIGVAILVGSIAFVIYKIVMKFR